MSLSARIAVGPSLRVALVACVVTTGGFIVAGVTAATCRPDAAAFVVAAAVAGWGLAIRSIVTRHRAAPRVVLSVSDRDDIGVDRYERPWRLVEPTMTWSGFSVLALADNDSASRGAILYYPLLGADVAPPHRRALSRFLLWSLRGGGRYGHP